MNREEEHSELELTAELREELDRRLADFEADPLAGEPLEMVKAQLLKQPHSPADL